ncbi:MAG: phage holin family protein [Isosphaeraceae bacterium]|nr:phage holin family protein [Isosphaeraceae bacterium]
MDDQTSVKSQNGARTNGMFGSLTEFGNSVATLAELQLKLAELDAKQAADRALVPLGVTAGGVAVVLASLPVILLGVATLLASAWHINQGWAMLLVGGATLAAAGVAVVAAGKRVGQSFESFRRSRDELTRNASWIRTVLLYSGRPADRKS